MKNDGEYTRVIDDVNVTLKVRGRNLDKLYEDIKVPTVDAINALEPYGEVYDKLRMFVRSKKEPMRVVLSNYRDEVMDILREYLFVIDGKVYFGYIYLLELEDKINVTIDDFNEI